MNCLPLWRKISSAVKVHFARTQIPTFSLCDYSTQISPPTGWIGQYSVCVTRIAEKRFLQVQDNLNDHSRLLKARAVYLKIIPNDLSYVNYSFN